MRRILITLSLAVAALAFAAVASAAPSPIYQVGGIETAVPQGNVSPFAGLAVGSTGDRATWRASVLHDDLTTCTGGGACLITGGTFTLTSNNGSRLDGTFMGGQLALKTPPAACGLQQFTVTASISAVAGPPLEFNGTLTHYRFPFRGQCRTIAATVQGTLTPGGTF
jgi:opacity protein-like surface antigen